MYWSTDGLAALRETVLLKALADFPGTRTWPFNADFGISSSSKLSSWKRDVPNQFRPSTILISRFAPFPKSRKAA